MLIYSNPDTDFKLMDYSITHSQLLLRSFRNRTRNYNIDVLFKVVDFVMIPDSIKGLELSVVEVNDTIASLLVQFNVSYKERLGDRVFCLRDAKGTNYHIVASSVGVFHSNMEFHESSLGRYDMGGFQEEYVLWYKGKEIERQ